MIRIWNWLACGLGFHVFVYVDPYVDQCLHCGEVEFYG